MDTPVEQPLTPIPWYRTRKFWAIVIGLLLAWSLFFYLSTFPHNREFLETYKNLSLAFGSGLFSFLGIKFFGEAGNVIFTVLYSVLALFLVYRTFFIRKVKIFYPITLLIIFTLGTLIILQVIIGLN